MAVGYFIAPYKEHTRPGARVCSMDDASADIFAAGGDWTETPVGGKDLGDALACVSAPAAILANLAVTFKPVVNPQLVIAAKTADPLTGAFAPSRTAPSLAAEVAIKDTVQARIEGIIAKADKEGYVRLPDRWGLSVARLLHELGKAGYGLDRVSTGTFPTTSLIDAFTRANAAVLGSGWTTLGGWSAMGILSNQAYNNGTNNTDVGAYRDAGTFGPDCEAYATVPVVGTVQTYYTMVARAVNPASTTTRNSHWFEIERNEGNHNLYVETANVGTVIGATTAQAYADGDSWGIECIGSTLVGYRKAAAGSWVAGPSRTATYTAAGYIGMAIWTGAATGNKAMDDFSGGTIVGGGNVFERRDRVLAALGQML